MSVVDDMVGKYAYPEADLQSWRGDRPLEETITNIAELEAFHLAVRGIATVIEAARATGELEATVADNCREATWLIKALTRDAVSYLGIALSDDTYEGDESEDAKTMCGEAARLIADAHSLVGFLTEPE